MSGKRAGAVRGSYGKVYSATGRRIRQDDGITFRFHPVNDRTITWHLSNCLQVISRYEETEYQRFP